VVIREDMSIPAGLRLLVGTSGGLYEFAGQEQNYFEGHDVTALAVGARQSWALVGGRTVWHSEPGGSWEEMAQVAGDPGTCLALTPAGLLAGSAGAHLLRLEGRQLIPIESFEQVAGREKWYTPWGDPPDSRSISVGPLGAIYVNVHVGGVVRSTDGGGSWHATLDIHRDVHQVLAHPTHPGLVLVAAAVGLGLSEDGGETWRFETEGLHAGYSRAVAIADGYILLSASTGPGGQRAALYRRRLGRGERFERCREGLPDWFDSNIDTACLAASGGTAAVGAEDGRVFVSTDAGDTWVLVAKGLPPVRCLSLA